MVLRCGVLCLLGFAVVNGIFLWRVREPISQGYGDFASFYTAGMMVRNGESARLYDPKAQWQLQQKFAAKVKIRRGPLPYIRPPFEAMLFLPFAYLSYPVACAVWLAVKIAILLAVPFVLPLPEGTGGFAWRSLLCLGFFPVGFDLTQGQDSILLLFLLAGALRLLAGRSYLLAGVVLGLGLFKFHLIVPFLLIFLLIKQGKVVLGSLATGIVLFLVSLGMVGWAGVLEYPRYLWRLNQAPGLGMVKPEAMPNFRGILTMLLGGGPLPVAAQVILVGLIVMGIVVAARSWRSEDRGAKDRSTVAAFCFSIVAMLVTSYYANSYDLTLLLIPLLMLGEGFLSGKVRGWPRAVFFVSSAVLLCTPVLWVVVLRVKQFCWIALALAAFGTAIVAAQNQDKLPVPE
jgi:hypothetical protein